MSKSIKKLYYSIGEVGKMTELKQYVLRYWETEFPSLSPSKNRAGNRIYRVKDIQLIQYIKHLLYKRKYTIEGARQRVKQIKPEQLKKFSELNNLDDLKLNDNPDQDKLIHVIREIKKGLKEILEILNEYS